MTYQNFAYFYDELMSHAPYNNWLKFTEDIMNKNELVNPRIVDLGCGTGEITLGLTNYSNDVVGVDYSQEMLSVAKNKAADQGKDIKLIHQDIRELEGFTETNLIVSYCDVINYLTEASDVEKVFNLVYHSLANNGIFAFDIHSQDYVLQHLINHTFADVSENTAYIWECHPGDEIGAMEHEMTFFVKTSTGMYRKITEDHKQQVFSHTFYLDALKKSGFRQIKISVNYDLENEEITEETDRIFITAKK
ncbi:MAG TPA: methyltransferase domain-containing protein [Pseudogracilibacillus sp.]|nr:methyltransferase domain-containing protein [Pseudogracilibacillus sp.]